MDRKELKAIWKVNAQGKMLIYLWRACNAHLLVCPYGVAGSKTTLFNQARAEGFPSAHAAAIQLPGAIK
jgi:hypothetical protein